MKPISQIFALSILEIPTLKKSGYIYENLEKKYKIAGMSSDNIEKKILAKKQRDVGDHLFSDILLQCDTQKNGNQSITKWFGN